MPRLVSLALGSLLLWYGVAAGSADVPSTQQEQPVAACPVVSLVPVPEGQKWTVQRDLLSKSLPDSIEGYCDLIRHIISLNWNPWDNPAAQAEGFNRAFVSFTIGHSGKLGDVITVETSIGASLFAESAVQAIRRSAPFPPVPADVAGDTLRVSVEFEATVKHEGPPP